jgi:hypothetical protein
MNEETIKNELAKYNVTDAAIAKLNTDYMALTVRDVFDNVGYEMVKKARIDIKKRRVEVEKTRVTLKAESLEYGRRVDGEAKRITALLEPIETHLIGQEKIVDDEKARIKAEAERIGAERLQARITTLSTFNAIFNGQTYLSYGLQIPAALVKVCTDDQFVQFIAQIQTAKDAEDARVKAEEDARKREIERMRLVAEEQQKIAEAQEAERKKIAAEAERIKAEQIEAERVRLQGIADEERKARIKERLETAEREKKEAAIRAEAERVRKEREEWEAIKAQEARDIAAAKQKVIDDARHAAELEKAKNEAAEKAKVEAEAKIKRESEDKALRERLALAAAEKKAARRPDKEKLRAYLVSVFGVERPELKTPEGLAAWKEIDAGLEELNMRLGPIVEAL